MANYAYIFSNCRIVHVADCTVYKAFVALALYCTVVNLFFVGSQVFERETHREKILEGRRREIKLKAKQASAAGGGGGVVAGGGGGG